MSESMVDSIYACLHKSFPISRKDIELLYDNAMERTASITSLLKNKKDINIMKNSKIPIVFAKQVTKLGLTRESQNIIKESLETRPFTVIENTYLTLFKTNARLVVIKNGIDGMQRFIEREELENVVPFSQKTKDGIEYGFKFRGKKYGYAVVKNRDGKIVNEGLYKNGKKYNYWYLSEGFTKF